MATFGSGLIGSGDFGDSSVTAVTSLGTVATIAASSSVVKGNGPGHMVITMLPRPRMTVGVS